MKVHIPYSSWLGNIEGFLRNIDIEDNTKLDISFDPKWISIHPVVLSIIGALGLEVMRANPGVYKNIRLTAHTKMENQLIKFNLLNMLNMDKKSVDRDLSGRIIPLTQIKDSTKLTETIQELVPLLHSPPKQADAIKYVMSEMIRNVLEHSQSLNGAILCAQYSKKSNRVSIGIADTGIGLKKALSHFHSPKDNLEAIKLALTPGITGTTSRIGGTEYNAGAGLFFTKSIAKVSNNFFILYSGDALFRLKKDKNGENDTKLNSNPLEDNCSLKNITNYWKGTVVGFDISLDSESEFQELLKQIRDVYSLDVKNRNKLKYKKPKFT
ncbi:MAG: ATP-binding protein [Flavobacterium sp.]|uniref:ATP-binding protein n=1 Tax=Flavobacterium sp. TaxID=239 RepID=UPI002B47C528|nr:ATP-binding protein [Flavobacterium sp.]WRH72934.1 MAG: ATP-binding protein [Flavobacterium sp.]